MIKTTRGPVKYQFVLRGGILSNVMTIFLLLDDLPFRSLSTTGSTLTTLTN